MGNRNTNIRLTRLTDKVIQNLKQLRDESRSFFAQKLFVKSGDAWQLPGSYEMHHNGSGIDIFKNGDHINTFSSKKVAVAWCILNANNKKEESRLLKYHDNKKYFLENDILINKKQMKSLDNLEDWNIIDARISDDYQKLNLSKKQIDKMINLAKYFQTRGFDHEAF